MVKMLISLFIFTVTVFGAELRISDEYGFSSFVNNVNSGSSYSGTTVYLDSDLSLSGTTNPIGNYTYQFKGTFDGQGHVISRLTISSSSLQFVGLFGYSTGLTIKNIILDNTCSITSTYSYLSYVGGIIVFCYAGNSHCNILNSVNMASVTFSESSSSYDLYLGGIAVRLISSSSYNVYVKNCANYGSVTKSGTRSSSYMGGIVGYSEGSNSYKFIQNCINYGTINHSGTSSYLKIGGIVGWTYSTYIQNCVSAGTITYSGASTTYAGSIVGRANPNTFINYCYFTSDVGVNYFYYGQSGSPTSIDSSLITNLNSQATSNGWNKWLLNLNGASVSFKFNGNKGFSTTSQIVLLPDLTSGSLVFTGWYTDSLLKSTFSSSSVSSAKTLYGGWLVTVTLNANGGGGIPASKSVVFSSTYGDLPTPSRTGYTFIGWYTETPEGDLVTSSTVVTLDYDHTLYAHWNPIQYTISFISDGERAYPNITHYYDTPITLPELSRVGYTFVCWCNDTDLELEYTAKRVESRNVTLYAKWVANIYTVSFKEECKVSRPPVSVTYDSEYNIQEPTSELGFLWWEIVETGQKVNESIVEVTHNHTLCAVWKTNTVTFNATGGDDNLEPVNVTYDDKYENLTNATRTGYTFVGWFINETSTEPVTNDTEVTIPYPHTLYARWRINSYTVTFDPDNGENVVKIFEYNNTIAYPEDPEKRGYTFSGWDNDTLEFMPAGDVTITAQWNANNYTVTLDVNGGDALAYDDIEVTFNSIYERLPVPTREGYSFAGWFNDEDENTTNETTVNKTEDHTLYAQWNANNCTVILEVNGGDELDNKKVNVVFNSTYGDLPTPSRTGYTFVGWYTEAPEGILVTNSTVVTLDYDHTLYAHWNPIQYTISFVSDGESQCPNITQGYDTPITLPVPSKSGYTFVCWCNDTYLEFEYTAKRIESRNITLYARWEANNYIVLFDVNGADGTTNQIEVTFDFPYGVLPELNKTGHTFAGWTDSLFGGNEVNSTTIVSISGNHTLYAIWVVNQYTMTFLSEGKEPVNITLNYNDMIVYPNKNPSKSFHRFSEWCTRGESGEEECNVTHVPDHDLTFIASFDVDSSLVTGITAVGAFAIVLFIILIIVIVFLIRVTRTVKHKYEAVGIEFDEDLNERNEDIEERIRQQVEATSISINIKKLEKPLKKADKSKGVEEILMDLEVDCENPGDIDIIDSYRTTNVSVSVVNAISNEKNLIAAAEYLTLLYSSVREQEEYEKFNELYFGMKDVDDFMNNMDEKTICFRGIVSGFTSKKVAIQSLISRDGEEETASMPSGVLFRVQNGMGYNIGKVYKDTDEVLFELCNSFKVESMKEINRDKYIVVNLSFVSPLTKGDMIKI